MNTTPPVNVPPSFEQDVNNRLPAVEAAEHPPKQHKYIFSMSPGCLIPIAIVLLGITCVGWWVITQIPH